MKYYNLARLQWNLTISAPGKGDFFLENPIIFSFQPLNGGGWEKKTNVCQGKDLFEQRGKKLHFNLSGQTIVTSHDLTTKWWFSKGTPLISGKSRLVKYYDLAKFIALVILTGPSLDIQIPF